MLRLKFEALEFHSGTLHFEGRPFTGITFKTHEGRVLESFYVSNGATTEDYTGDLIKLLPGSMRLLSDCEGLAGESEYDEMITLNGIPYNGVIYDFDGIFCVGEAVFEKGRETQPSVQWHTNGILAGYDNFKNGAGDAIEWHKNGQLHRIYTVLNHNDRLSAEFEENGGLRVLQIKKGLFEAAKSQSPAHTFPVIYRPNDLAHFKPSSYLFLAGEGVDTNVFDILAKNGLERVEVFKAFDTSLADAQLYRIAQLPQIKLLSVDSLEEGRHLKALLSIKQSHPRINVCYNGDELD